MYKIIYYNLSDNFKINFLKSGRAYDINTLIKYCSVDKMNPEKIKQLIDLIDINVLDSNGIKKTSQWDNLMTVIIYCISGKIPLRQEVLRGRQIIMSLPKEIKKDYMPELSFSLLPYLLIGFKLHTENTFYSDSNKISDVVNFIVQLSKINNPKISSFLCAHRGTSTIKQRHILVNNVKEKQVKKIINLFKGILTNSPWTELASINWYQQDATKYASSNMFPEMFIKYLDINKTSRLLFLLKRHFSQIKTLFRNNSTKKIKFNLIEMDNRTVEVVKFLEKKYGKSWQTIDFYNIFILNKDDFIVNIAIELTLPNILRQMPFYSDIKRKKHYLNNINYFIKENKKTINRNILIDTKLIGSSIKYFFKSQIMHPTAKAVYETTFYYIWGRNCALNKDEIAIGVDRDHSSFQYLAWKKGYDDVTKSNPAIIKANLLYLRRANENCKGESLKDYSLRQFWR